jgi:hypothetical protein
LRTVASDRAYDPVPSFIAAFRCRAGLHLRTTLRRRSGGILGAWPPPSGGIACLPMQSAGQQSRLAGLTSFRTRAGCILALEMPADSFCWRARSNRAAAGEALPGALSAAGATTASASPFRTSGAASPKHVCSRLPLRFQNPPPGQ